MAEATPVQETPCPAARGAEPTALGAAPLTLGVLFRRLGWTGPLAVISLTLPAIGGFLLIGTMNRIGPWLASLDGLGIALYVVGFALMAGLALLPTYAQSALGGMAFGFAAGLPAALAGFLGGAVLGYWVGRRAAGDRVVELITEYPKWKAVYDALLGSGSARTLLIVALLRLPPNSPFAITNLVLAATRVRPWIFALGTLLGMAPRTAVVVFLAAWWKDLDVSSHEERWVFIGGLVVTLVVVAIIGALANRAVARVTRTVPSAATTGAATPP